MEADLNLDNHSVCRNFKRRKLLLHEKVEVRSVEVGFEGSWHPASVIACDYQVRHVKYDHLLNDNDFQNIVETRCISPIIDGLVDVDSDSCNYRGVIRPWPPHIEVGQWCLHYGLCVDFWFNEAWWEGVVFDHEDGSEERTVFFPDIGDEMKIEIYKLRISQDWNEVSGTWERRGNWVFLELLEEYEQEREIPLFVSVRQLWYDLREKRAFEVIKEWTCSDKSLWRTLVFESIDDYHHCAINTLSRTLDVNSLGLVPEITALLELPGPATNGTLKQQAEFAAILPAESKPAKNSGLFTEERPDQGGLIHDIDDDKTGLNYISNTNVSRGGKVETVKNWDLSVVPYNSDQSESSDDNSNEDDSGTSSDNTCKEKPMNPTNWIFAGPDIVRPMFRPDAATEYLQAYSINRKPGISLAIDVRKHLSFLGWKMWTSKLKNSFRYRYITPSGKVYYSLIQICQDLEKRISIDDHSSLPVSRNDISSSLCIKKPKVREKRIKLPPLSGSDNLAPQYCPEAVLNWIKFAKRKDLASDNKCIMSLKAKKHLLAAGWILSHVNKGGIYNEKRELRYRSPKNKQYITLLAACQACIDEGGDSIYKGTTFTPMEDINFIEEAESHLYPNKICVGLTNMELECQNSHNRLDTLVHHKKVTHSKDKILSKSKRSKLFGTVAKSGNDVSNNSPTRVLRSRKRGAPSSSTGCPRTVLSWLIDNNMVLPRAKVQYGDRNDYPMAKGWIARDGIKCSCCNNVFTLSAFETHAGSTKRRPAANIFLEDGRSLLECQVEMMETSKKKAFKLELCDRQQPKGFRRLLKSNDNICSVCHDGGELLLCDQCPSSFHKACLGLKDVPEGDWFCQSCCCVICEHRNYEGISEHNMDDNIRNCDQCERQYHMGCLRKRALLQVENPEGNWFCNKICQKIYFGLQKLLGKQVALGMDNLSWTLLKSRKYKNSDSIPLDIEGLAESNSKLNVALDVMHECFEPVKEARTQRDLVEDVIFSRGSDLNRLNFLGFYTVLLEKNDELVSAATVRVFGEKVAEVPLVATRFQYRRKGLCRILIDELEKILTELGVERLVLPAVPSVLNTWTTAFGFSRMPASERRQFLHYTFLDFQGTVMCQKHLKRNRSTELSLPGEIQLQHKASDKVDGGYTSIDVGMHSAISEVFQSEQMDHNEIVDQEIVDTDGNCSQGSNIMGPSSMNPETPIQCDYKKKDEHDGNRVFRCYKRRRVVSNGSELRSICTN